MTIPILSIATNHLELLWAPKADSLHKGLNVIWMIFQKQIFIIMPLQYVYMDTSGGILSHE